jgi:hypothetical protein
LQLVCMLCCVLSLYLYMYVCQYNLEREEADKEEVCIIEESRESDIHYMYLGEDAHR